jgi:hypothetical protein
VDITQVRETGAGLGFFLILLSGIWLSRTGKPLNVVILTIHKLISLATLVFLALTIYQMSQTAVFETVELAAGAFTALFFLATIATGGLLSTEKPLPAAILTTHKLTAVLVVLSTAATLYVL